MVSRITAFAGVLVLLFAINSNSMAEDKILKMSTTTSTQSSGLLDILLPEFEKATGIKVKVIAKGTGAAIRDGEDGNVDIIFVHAKGRELAFVKDGFGTERFPVMHNDFVLLGSSKDPAGIKDFADIATVFKTIAEKKATFVSRGDDSGTHTKEQKLWADSGITMVEKTQSIVKKGQETKITSNFPADSASWYLSIGQGMGKVLTYAEEKQAYTLSDRGTYIKYKYGKTPALELDILSQGDTRLANPYGIIPVNPAKHPHVKNDLAMAFVEWITGPEGQKLIGDYRLEGKQLFFPDAIK
ncbi:ABC-type tungstate transport system, permease component [Desulfocapsa sulfexigens DSM 10523]|uniref:ABC-type tungstate transport system, permease component n=1 Tax=Desulfocapsa sulfexigens (strain DSM 10523 / SB164P1) TaxID=1167006 RepID=M1P8K5_DESSD|nr:extracellular solute-binding protein [Desulfocapsa sulfexigens]AGF79818.1 ABC-type tungstate transport system, permease component [Desulfocapsa sulfexigens DSM 10523]